MLTLQCQSIIQKRHRLSQCPRAGSNSPRVLLMKSLKNYSHLYMLSNHQHFQFITSRSSELEVLPEGLCCTAGHFNITNVKDGHSHHDDTQFLVNPATQLLLLVKTKLWPPFTHNLISPCWCCSCIIIKL